MDQSTFTIGLYTLTCKFALYVEKNLLSLSDAPEKIVMILSMLNSMPEFMLRDWIVSSMKEKPVEEVMDKYLSDFQVEKSKLSEGRIKKLSAFIMAFQNV